MGIRDAFIFPLSPPPIPELGTASGFTFRLQDRGGNGHEALVAARNQLLGMAGAEQGADAGAARRPGGRAAAAARHRPRQGQCAGRGASTRINADAVHGAGLGLRQRLPEPRPPAARGGAGRRAGAHAARGPAAPERAATARASRCRCRPSPRTRWVTGADADRALQRLPGDAHRRRRRRRATAPARRWPRWSAWPRSCRRASATSGPASRARKSSPARRR